tara:strand:- start:168 stop:392 length:225 start_codon:yes stop_codon:yes gene_type:complete
MNNIAICGAVIATLGIAGFAAPLLAAQSSENSARNGGIRYQATEITSNSISPYRSGGVLFLGLVIFGSGFFRFD